MPVKVNEFLRSIIDPLKLGNQDIEAALNASGLKEIELPDLVTAKFNENYLTLDRASSDDKVLAKARGAVYAMVEQRLAKKVKGKLKEEDQRAYEEAPQLFDKIDMLEKAMDNIAAAPADDVKKIEEKWRKTEGELRGTIKTLEENAKTIEQNKKVEVEGLRVDYALRSKIAGIELAPEYSDPIIRESLDNSSINFLKSNFVLQFDEKNPSTVNLRKNADGVVVDVYEFEGEKRQTPFTLDDVVKKRYEKFIKKNNADGKDQNGQQQQTPKKQLEIPNDRPLTLREKMLQSAGV